jgi:hypothetical protein
MTGFLSARAIHAGALGCGRGLRTGQPVGRLPNKSTIPGTSLVEQGWFCQSGASNTGPWRESSRTGLEDAVKSERSGGSN